MKRLLIIPARIGSKRILKKNIKSFLGEPIIYYSIKTAKKSRLFDKIHISTESTIIKKLIEKKNLKIDFMRDNKLSNDKAGLLEVFKFVINKYKKIGLKFKEVWFLTPCSPLIQASDLISASKIFKKNNSNAMLAISEYSPPIQWAFKLSDKMKLNPINKKKLKYRSQNLTKTFYDTGTFGVFDYDTLKKNKKINYTGFQIPRYKGIDIDTKQDWKLAEKIFKSDLK